MTDTASRYPANDDTRPFSFVRETHDSQTHHALGSDPSDHHAMADIANDESFPASDAPSYSAADQGEAALSSGYDAGTERLIAEERPHASAQDEAATHITETDASGGTKLGTMRFVLSASLALVIAALALLLILNR